MADPFSPKQMEFIIKSTAKWNFAHGSVRSGKTVCTLWRFMEAVDKCPDDKIYIVGHTFDSAYRNVIRLLLNSDEMLLYRPFCTWSGKKLHYKDKTIMVLGAKDEGAVGNFQGDTYSLVYCDEMTLYPESIIQMINSRLSKPHSMGFAAMNPSHPKHIIKQWIDAGEEGDSLYYSLHFTVEDNPFLPENYIKMLRQSSSGIFYKRNYLGLWCLAEGAIFDFFDRDIYVKKKAPRAAEYYIAGIDVGTTNAFACLLIGVNSGVSTQMGKCLWVEKEYYWSSKVKGRQKTNSEYADDVQAFLDPYGVRHIYVDPSAAAFKVDLQRRGLHVIDANNDVENGIQYVTSEMRKGNLFVLEECKNTIREIEGYVWDQKSSERGYDEPLKKDDHTCDAMRYAVFTHKVTTYDPYKHNEYQKDYLRDRYAVTRNYR